MNRMWIGMLCVLWPLAASAQNIRLSDGTIAVKAVIYDSTGTTGVSATEATALLMRSDTASIATSLDNIEAALSADAVHDNAALTTGPQLMAVGSTATPTAVTADGDSVRVWADRNGRLRIGLDDPCSRGAKTYYVVDTADGTNLEISNAVASEYFYICSVNLVADGATVVLISEDDTDGCGSPTAGLNGGSTGTTTEGWSFAANGGLTLGNGQGTVMKTATANRYLCLDQSGTVQLSGTIGYVSAP